MRLAALLWGICAFGMTEPGQVAVIDKRVPAPAPQARVCSIPLINVLPPGPHPPMPVLKPRDNISRMPMVKLPAPPCAANPEREVREDKRK